MDALKLENLEPFGVGGRRECYVHPENASRCVKVLRTDDRRTIRLSAKRRWVPPRWRREYDNNADEARELHRVHLRIGDVMAAHLPLCHGFEETDLGPGLVLDLVRDHDGRISRSIRELASTGVDPGRLEAAYKEFSGFLLSHRILTRNLHDHNLVAKDLGNDRWRLMLIDGVGDPAWLPLARWIPFLGRRKVAKRLARAWPRIVSFAKSGGVTDELREESSWDQGFLRHRGE